MGLKQRVGSAWEDLSGKLKLWDGRRWVTMSEDDDSAGLWIRVLGVTAATVRGSIVRWQPVSAEYPFAEFYTNITRGSNRLSGSAMSAARVHNRPLSLVDDAIRGIDYSRIPSGYRFSGKCLVVYRLMWDITGGASGAAGAGGGPSGQAHPPGPSGQQAGAPPVTTVGFWFHNRRQVPVFYAAVPSGIDGDQGQIDLQFFSDATVPDGATLTTGWHERVGWYTMNDRSNGGKFVSAFMPVAPASAAGVIVRVRTRRFVSVGPGQTRTLISGYTYGHYTYPRKEAPPGDTTPPPPVPADAPDPAPSALRVEWQESGNDIIVIPSATNGVTFRTRARFGSGNYSLPSPPNVGRFYQYSTGNRRYAKPSGATTITVELFAKNADGLVTGPAYFTTSFAALTTTPSTPQAPTVPPPAPTPPPSGPVIPDTEPTEEEAENPQTEGPGEVVQQLGGSDQPGINIELASQVFPVGAVNPDNWETLFVDIGVRTPPTSIKFIGTGRTGGNYNDLLMWPSPNYADNSWDWRSVYVMLLYERTGS